MNCSMLSNYFHIVKIYQLFRTPTYLKWIQGENDKEYIIRCVRLLLCICEGIYTQFNVQAC